MNDGSGITAAIMTDEPQPVSIFLDNRIGMITCYAHRTHTAMISNWAFFALLSFLFLAEHSLANDSTSHPTSTGIEFTQNNDISIESESLILSERTVQVQYSFYNHAPQEVAVTMAFPLPQVDPTDPMQADAGDPEGWHFLVYINGKADDDVKVRWRALVNGIDKALILQRLRIPIGLPPIRHLSSGVYCLEDMRLHEQDRAALVREGLVYEDSMNGSCLVPRWTAQAVYLWEAKFAPKSITEVKHTYNQWPGYRTCLPGEPCSEAGGEFTGVKKIFGDVPVDVYFYEYVFHTGGNWKGPIKTFNFRAEGPRESFSMVVAPFPVTRISDNTLIATIHNYKPLSRAEQKGRLQEEDPKPEQERLWNETGEIRFVYMKKHEEQTK